MNNLFKEIILKATGASAFSENQKIQDLWSGYGKILRLDLEGSKDHTVVIKHIKLPDKKNHPRGWNTNISHKRKLKSYNVEMAWYTHYSEQCDETCRVPCCLVHESQGEESLIVLEDLDAAGFPKRKKSANWNEMQACISWLANFHATFLCKKPSYLWKTGTYWHLDTRPDELKALDDSYLKAAAGKIDQKLKACRFQTFVHGDAKLANFCFSRNGKNVAAVDFQYIGGGCGMKDLAYFVGSCLYEEQCQQMEQQILDYYFQCLHHAIQHRKEQVNAEGVFNELETEWRGMYHIAWTDFHRFIKGWSPGHWKINSYSEKIAQKVISQL